MKKVLAGVGKIVLAVFTLAIVGFMAVMSYETLGRVYPDDPLKQVWGMALFSIGTVAWFVTFLYASEGAQRPVALLMFVLSIVGEVVYATADVFMGGQTWVAVDPAMGQYVLWTFIGMTFAHGVALYIHFLVEPSRMSDLELSAMQDQAREVSLRKAAEMMQGYQDQIADALARKAVSGVFSDMALPLPGTVIEGVARDVLPPAPVTAPKQEAKKLNAPGLWGSLFGKKAQPEAAPVAQVPAKLRPAVSYAAGRTADGQFVGYRFSDGNMEYATPVSYASHEEALTAAEGGGETDKGTFRA